MADRKKMVTSIKFKRPLQTNEPTNDKAIPTDGYVSVIGAIGTLNSKREANAHSHDGLNVNSEDIRIDFSSRVSIDTVELRRNQRINVRGIFLDGSRLQIITRLNTR